MSYTNVAKPTGSVYTKVSKPTDSTYTGVSKPTGGATLDLAAGTSIGLIIPLTASFGKRLTTDPYTKISKPT